MATTTESCSLLTAKETNAQRGKRLARGHTASEPRREPTASRVRAPPQLPRVWGGALRAEPPPAHVFRGPRTPVRPWLGAGSPSRSNAGVDRWQCAAPPSCTPLSQPRSPPAAGGWQRSPRRWAWAVRSMPAAYLAGSRGNLKKAKSDCVLFRVQLGAAQKFGIVARPPAGPALPSPPPQGSPPARRGRGGEPGRPAGSAGPTRGGGAGGREAARARRGAAVRGRAGDAAPQCCERPGGFTAAAAAGAPPARPRRCRLLPTMHPDARGCPLFPQPSSPAPPFRLLRRRARAKKRACRGVARRRRDLARAAAVRLRTV